jgi:ABC-2 type transport system permease protein
MQYIVLIDPLVYVSEGMRAALTPTIPHMPIGALLAALIALAALFLWLGLRAFRRRAIS